MEVVLFRPIHVLNPGGRDPDQDFAKGPGLPGSKGHPPTNYHAYAACCGGAFLRSVPAAVESDRPVLLLLRSDLKAAGDALTRLRRRPKGGPVWVAIKEAGRHQVAAWLANPVRLTRFREMLARADGFLASTPWLEPFALQLGARRAAFVPTPYPVDVPGWCASERVQARRAGILIGTREFDVPSRNHLAAITAGLELSRRTGEPLTVMATAGARERRLLDALCTDEARLTVVPGPVSYAEWLEIVARHRIVFQLDRSEVPGQVAGDALLAGTPCIGGDGAVDRIAFRDLHGAGREPVELMEMAARLLTDPAAWERAVRDSAARGLQSLSFRAVAARLSELLV